MAAAQTNVTLVGRRKYSQPAGMLAAAGALVAVPVATAQVGIYTRTVSVQYQNPIALLSEVNSLKERVAKLEAAIEIVDELDWGSALARARDFFTSSKRSNVYPTELAEYLGTSISQAMDLCEFLAAEGVVVGA
jgi:hypothetical protein